MPRCTLVARISAKDLDISRNEPSIQGLSSENPLSPPHRRHRHAGAAITTARQNPKSP